MNDEGPEQGRGGVEPGPAPTGPSLGRWIAVTVAVLAVLGGLAIILRERTEDPNRFRGVVPPGGEPQPYRIRLTEPATIRAVLTPRSGADLQLLAAVDEADAAAVQDVLGGATVTTLVPADLGPADARSGIDGVIVAQADAGGTGEPESLELRGLAPGTYRLVVAAGAAGPPDAARFELLVEIIPGSGTAP